MLADLLKVSVRTVRRWNRAGLLPAAIEIMQIPHFDFASLTTAKQLAGWMRQGVTVSSMQLQIEALRKRIGSDAALDELPIQADGQQLIIQDGDQYLESSGQLRLGFEPEAESTDLGGPATVKFTRPESQDKVLAPEQQAELSLEAMVEQAIIAEDADDLETAVRWYRSVMTVHGLNADICFQIAELLYRSGDVCGARERYFTALEIEPELLEARANLGCVLLECQQADLAIAAFEGALAQYPDYADVHFHLARALEELGEANRAVQHWQRFLELAPNSPWAEEAQHRLKDHAFEHMPLHFGDADTSHRP